MKDKRVYFIFGTAAVVLLLFFVLTRETKQRYSWMETYEEESKDPYGTYVIHQLLQTYFPGKEFIEVDKKLREVLPAKTAQPASYVFVGEALFLDTADVNRLLAFAENGNDVFIASKTIPYDLMFYVYYEECNGYYWNDYALLQDTVTSINVLHNDLRDSVGMEYKYLFQHKTKEYEWSYIDSVYFCEEDFSPIELGLINDRFANFVKKSYGNGNIYLHTTPLAFSNIQLLDKKGLNYTQQVFSHLKSGNIYWDGHSRIEESVGRRRNNRSQNSPNRNMSDQSPLKYILAQTPLAWAWYTMLALILLYVLFRAKRKQRVIPVLPANENSSLEFISTIGTLYFLQNDHKKLALQKMRLFLSYIRDRYQMNTNELDEKFVRKLAIRSEIPATLIEKIIAMHQQIKGATGATEQTLIDFHLEMDKFYKNCK